MSLPTPPAPDLGRVRLPAYLPVTFVIVLAAGVALGWRDLHTRSDNLQRDIDALQASHNRTVSETKAKDAAFEATITSLRDQATARQEILLTRLTRIETILERLERQNASPPSRP